MAQDLATLIAMQGRLILDDRAHLVQKMREAWPSRTRAINLLLTAFDSGAVHDFSAAGSALDPLTMERMAQSLADSTGTQIDFARWALDVWHKTFVPMMVTPAVAAPSAAAVSIQQTSSATPPPPSGDDLTWEDDAASLIHPAPSISPAPADTTAAPSPGAGVTPLPPKKKSVLKWVALAAILIAVAGGGLWAAGVLRVPDIFLSEPEYVYIERKPVTASSQVLVAPGQPVTAAQVKEALTDITIDGMQNNKEPTFPSAYKADASQEHWQFEFNIKYESGKRFAYHVNFIGRNDAGESQGVVTAIDRSLSDDRMLSVSNPIKIENKPSSSRNGHFAWGFTWAKNPSGVPPLCIQIYTTPERPGQSRYPAQFFVYGYTNSGSCDPKLGSGTLQ